MLQFEIPWSWQPPAGAQPRPGLKLLAHPPNGFTNIDAVNGDRSIWTAAGAAQLGVGKAGHALQLNGSSGYLLAAAPLINVIDDSTPQYTIAAVFQPSNTSTRGTIFSMALGQFDSTVPYIWLEVNASSGRAAFNSRDSDSVNETISPTNSFAAEELCTVVVTQRAPASRLMVLNGNFSSSATGSTNRAGKNITTFRHSIGAYHALSPSIYYQGKIYLVAFELRSWSEGEIFDFHATLGRNQYMHRKLFAPDTSAATTFIPIVGRGPGMSLARVGGGLAHRS